MHASASDGTSVYDVLRDVEKAAAAAKSDSDRRSLYTVLGSLNEQVGSYAEASRWYAAAAGIAAAPAAGTPSYTSEQLVLAAVRTALGCGDYGTAESYLASIRDSKNEDTTALVKLYNVWIWLCRAEDEAGLLEPVVLLESYASLATMEQVRPAVYFTLWYVTGKSVWAEKIAAEYPDSPERAVVTGASYLYPAPFWFFVPRLAAAEPLSAEFLSAVSAESSAAAVLPHGTSAEAAAESVSAAGAAAESAGTVVKQQLGFFRSRANAEALADRVRAAGFAPVVSEEARPSGTVYFVVTVAEDGSGTTGLKLKSAGFECYPVFAE